MEELFSVFPGDCIQQSSNPYKEAKKTFFSQLHTSEGKCHLIISNEFPDSVNALIKYLDIMAHYYPDENLGIQRVFDALTVKEWAFVRAYEFVNSK